VLLELNEDDVRTVGAQMRDAHIEAVAIGFMHAWGHPAHEQRARDILAPMLGPDVSICLSSEVCPEIREYERFSTTVANAYVRPLMGSYLFRLQDSIRQKGLHCPMLLMMSGGGLTTLELAARFPIRLVESGPAGGAILAAHLARECGLDKVLAFDMGGTTAKICLINNGQPERSRRFEIGRVWKNLKGSGLPIRIPVIELVEIGAGGGSIGRVDALQRITVGPDSCGSEPGPACYGRGGELPAVTDANVVLGRIDPERVGEATISEHLHRPDIPDVDLFIRTSGEQRSSNFMLWQAAYAEYVFQDKLWPDYDRRDLWAACEEYVHRNRRFGRA
jgi:N-methylhydantoinase A